MATICCERCGQEMAGATDLVCDACRRKEAAEAIAFVDLSDKLQARVQLVELLDRVMALILLGYSVSAAVTFADPETQEVEGFGALSTAPGMISGRALAQLLGDTIGQARQLARRALNVVPDGQRSVLSAEIEATEREVAASSQPTNGRGVFREGGEPC